MRLSLHVLLLSAALAGATRASAQVGQVTAGGAVYVREDSDSTTVIAPRLHVGTPVGDASRVDLVYTVDVWTSASVDITASASKPVTEQRDEINATVSHELEDAALSGTYRYSHEPDYESHGASLGSSFFFAEKNTTLDLRFSATLDEVGRAGFPTFEEPVRNLAAKLGLTQILGAATFGQIAYELMNAHGFNSSPYRYVGFGSPNGLCTTDPQLWTCVPEKNPNDRLRHAAVLLMRHAFSDSWSAGLEYRFYLDSWGVMSHTAQAELNWTLELGTMFGLRYRFYSQGAADQYQPSYSVTDTSLDYFSNDKELSAFMAHKLAVDFEHDIELDARGHLLSVTLTAAPSIFRYSNYRPLDQITAIEVTLATVFKL